MVEHPVVYVIDGIRSEACGYCAGCYPLVRIESPEYLEPDFVHRDGEGYMYPCACSFGMNRYLPLTD